MESAVPRVNRPWNGGSRVADPTLQSGPNTLMIPFNHRGKHQDTY